MIFYLFPAGDDGLPFYFQAPSSPAGLSLGPWEPQGGPPAKKKKEGERGQEAETHVGETAPKKEKKNNNQ